ncbi:O-antigen ligase family protein [Chryseobacterium panacisoli]|uniref:O-antigen ligase family protein n=1 Tax=Chryseobacterium panacisoli TaxID=1807141 RepID=A0A5D8ZE87_9FLAO|nr:O-antigen ligase family protein [Chryseobacterium panacisoli]TZF92412.1 O-antigen ligase family protein [Chryseobacterium panacisoli]
MKRLEINNTIDKFTKSDYLIGISICFVISILYMFNLNQIVVGGLSILLFLFYFNRIRKRATVNEAFTVCLILTLPFSFSPLVGSSFFSLFIIIQFLFICVLLASNFSSKKNQLIQVLGLGLLLFCLGVYFFNQSNYPKILVETLIKTLLFLLIIIIALIKLRMSDLTVSSMMKFYVFAASVAGLMVLIQYLSLKILGINYLGVQNQFGKSRTGFAGLFYDYSISSIYLSSASLILCYGLLTKKYIINYKLSIIFLLFTIGTSVLTSGRSGIAALFIALFFLLIYLRNIKIIVVSLIVGFPLVKTILYIYSLNRTTNLSNDSGRLDNYLNALNYFYKDFWFGARFLGFSETSKSMLPHNFILDFLVQYGVIFTLLLLLFLIVVWFKGLKKQPILFFLFLLMLVGGNFHASFINTHYIVIPLILIIGTLNNNESISYHK